MEGDAIEDNNDVTEDDVLVYIFEDCTRGYPGRPLSISLPRRRSGPAYVSVRKRVRVMRLASRTKIVIRNDLNKAAVDCIRFGRSGSEILDAGARKVSVS